MKYINMRKILLIGLFGLLLSCDDGFKHEIGDILGNLELKLLNNYED